MQQFNLWETNYSNLITYVNTIQDVIKYIKENGQIGFSVIDKNGLQDGVTTTFFTDAVYRNAKDQNIEITCVDETHPFFYDNFENMYFSKAFFNQNKDIIINTIEDNMLKKEHVHVSKYTYSEDLIKRLCLTATSIYFDEEIVISEKIKNILKSKRIDSYTYKDGKRIEISTSKILGNSYEDVISDSSNIIIYNDITDLENLKYIPEHKIIHIKQINRFKEDSELLEDYDSLYNIVSKLRENGQNNKIFISVKNRSAFSKSKLYNSNFDIVVDGIDLEPYKLAELKKEDELLDLMVKDIKSKDYSPFEKYIAAYNIVKKFKSYLENKNDKSEARYIRKLLNNDYMVCVGYAKLLEELLKRIGISTYDYSVSTDLSYDKGFSVEEKPVKFGAHARVIVKIDDPKYGINGFYVADPTWDNNLEKDYYNHALMSFDKTSKERRMFRLSNEDLIMNVKNMEEFSLKVNFLIDHLKSSPFNKMLDEKEKETSAIRSLVNIINNILISLLPEKYVELKNQYADLLKGSMDMKAVSDFITKAGEIFIGNLGKDVSINTIIEAASTVNKDVFGFNDDQASVYKEELLQMNIEMDKLQFPYYYDNSKIK